MKYCKLPKCIGFVLARLFGKNVVGLDASGDKLTIAKGAEFLGVFYIFKIETIDAQFKNEI